MVGRAGEGGSGASALQCDGCAGTCPSWPRAIRRSDAWRGPHGHGPCGYPARTSGARGWSFDGL